MAGSGRCGRTVRGGTGVSGQTVARYLTLLVDLLLLRRLQPWLANILAVAPSGVSDWFSDFGRLGGVMGY